MCCCPAHYCIVHQSLGYMFGKGLLLFVFIVALRQNRQSLLSSLIHLFMFHSLTQCVFVLSPSGCAFSSFLFSFYLLLSSGWQFHCSSYYPIMTTIICWWFCRTFFRTNPHAQWVHNRFSPFPCTGSSTSPGYSVDRQQIEVITAFSVSPKKHRQWNSPEPLSGCNVALPRHLSFRWVLSVLDR